MASARFGSTKSHTRSKSLVSGLSNEKIMDMLTSDNTRPRDAHRIRTEQLRRYYG